VCIILRPLWILEKHFAWKLFLHRLPELSPPCFVLSFRGPWLVMYADDTSCKTVGETVEESKKKLEIAAQEIMKYMEEN
jgi:hypothetical protein